MLTVDGFFLLFGTVVAEIILLVASSDSDSNVHYLRRRIQPATTASGEFCRISLELQGSWYQKDFPEPLEISENSFDLKGACVQRKHNKYLFHLKTQRNSCYRCVIFFAKHHNVIQYKESQCIPSDSMDEACSMLYGDLVYLFRADAQSIPCPIRGPMNFTYRAGSEACESRKSRVDGCASNTLIQFRYEACPEVARSTTRTEKFQCVGTWSKGHGQNFFAAKMLDNPLGNAAENYRCFVYTKTSFGGKIGISADASCRELVNIRSAEKQIAYDQDSYPAPKCTFVHWLRHYHHDRGRQKLWESMSSHSILSVGKHHWTVYDKNTHKNQTVMTCIQVMENAGRVDIFVVYKVDNNCNRGYHCVKVYKRSKSGQVMEIVTGEMTHNAYEACNPEFFSDTLQEFDTYVLTDSIEQRCPNHGRYRIHGCDEDTAMVSFGCTKDNQLVVDRHCGKEQKTYNCHGHWELSGANYLVLREQHTGKKMCYVYSKRGEVLTVSGFYRHPCRLGILAGVNKRMVHSFNATFSGEYCQPSSAALSNTSSHSQHFASFPLCTALIIVLLRLVLSFT